MKPVVSIIMPVYNSAAFIRETLTSVQGQSFTNFELLLCDDGSTDETGAIASTFGDRRFHWLPADAQRGPAAARNRGLDAAKGDWIAFWDSDDLAIPERLERQLHWLERNPEVGFLAAGASVIDSTGRPTGSVFLYDGSPDTLRPMMLFRNCVCTSTIMLRKAEISGMRFDEEMVVASDYEFWVRVLDKTKAFVLKDILVQYRHHSGNISHRKASKADDCLREIASRQLRRLKIAPTSAELDIHLGFFKLTHGTSQKCIRHTEEWLLKLKNSNHRRKVYQEDAFGHVLGEMWFRACYSACCHGWWTWKTFNASPLAQLAQLTPAQTRRFQYLVFRGALKRALCGRHEKKQVP